MQKYTKHLIDQVKETLRHLSEHDIPNFYELSVAVEKVENYDDGLLEAAESLLKYQSENQRFHHDIKIREIDILRLANAVLKARGDSDA